MKNVCFREQFVSFPSPETEICLSCSPGHRFCKRKVSQHGTRQSMCMNHTPARESRNGAGNETTVISQVFTHIAEYRHKLAEKWKQSRVDVVHEMQGE